jgi:hypothetical protein
MKSRLIWIVFSLLIIGSGNAANRKNRVTANAGTGPYNFGPQTGFKTMSTLQAAYIAAVLSVKSSDSNAIVVALQELKFQVEKRPKIRDLGSLIGALIPASPNPDPPSALRLNSIDVVSVNKLLTSIRARVQPQIDEEEPPKSIASFSAGFFFNQSSAYEFNNLILSSSEDGSSHNSRAAYFTAGSYVPINESQALITGRLGAGIAFGDPYRTIGSISGASYLSPGALDVAGTVSTLVKPGKPLPKVTFTRTLVDHIRPGEAWLTLSLRQISGTTNPKVLVNGTMGEVELTFATNDIFRGTYRATTFTLSGIYSANKRLGVDELGIDFRTPVASKSFLCGRYGTRGHYTVSLEMKL